MQKELDYLQGAVDVPKRPFAAIVGGSKVSSKISVIEAMLSKVDKLVLGGGMVFTFLKVRRGQQAGTCILFVANAPSLSPPIPTLQMRIGPRPQRWQVPC